MGEIAPLPSLQGGADAAGVGVGNALARARSFRGNGTLSERRLWNALKNRQTGAKFSRQIAIGPYFADFVCRMQKLIIEVDGPSHEMTHEHDARRTTFLEQQGYRIVRVNNHDVRDTLDDVIALIAEALRPTPARCASLPLPEGRGEF